MAKNHKNSMVIDEKGVRYFDEDGYELKNPVHIKEWNRKNLEKDKQKWLKEQTLYDYKLSRWGQEVVKILQEKDEMKNVDIIAELRKRGCNTSATHIRAFFKSNDGMRFYNKELVGNQGYWSLRNNQKR
jgi:hypothetical protein